MNNVMKHHLNYIRRWSFICALWNVFFFRTMTVLSQVPPTEFDEEIYFIESSILQRTINDNSEFSEYIRDQFGDVNLYDYFFWTKKQGDWYDFIVPKSENPMPFNKSNHRILKLASEDSNGFIITAREMVLAKLSLAARQGQFSLIKAIDKRLKLSPYEIRFYLFIGDSTNLRFRYCSFDSDELRAGVPGLGSEDAKQLYKTLRAVKDDPNNLPVNISFIGYFNGVPIGIGKSRLSLEGFWDFPLEYKSRGYEKARINLKPIVGLEKIQNLRTNKLLFEYGEQDVNFNTWVYDDLLFGSTIESYDSTFVLTYFKTSNFKRRSAHINFSIEKEIKKMREIVSMFLEDCAFDVNDTLYLEFTGYADSTRLGDVLLDDIIGVNDSLAVTRASAVESLFTHELRSYNTAIPHKTVAVRSCDPVYFGGNDRSVEIKAWIRSRGEKLLRVRK